jgi:hypothetical protein
MLVQLFKTKLINFFYENVVTFFKNIVTFSS